MADKWQNYVGEICTSQDGDKKFIKVIKDFTVYAGQRILLKKYSENVKQLFDNGYLDEAEMESKLSRKWISYVLNIPPQELPTKKEDLKLPKRAQWLNECLNICQNGKGDYYISVKKTFKVEKGDAIQLQKVDVSFKEMMDKGIVTEEKYLQMLEGIKMKGDDGKVIEGKYWLHFRGTLPPKDK